MRTFATTAVLLVSLLAGASASAHEGGIDLRGTVNETAAGRIVLTTQGGEVRTVAVEPGTRILRGPAVVSLSHVRVGERTVVHATMRKGKLVATEVRLPSKAR